MSNPFKSIIGKEMTVPIRIKDGKNVIPNGWRPHPKQEEFFNSVDVEMPSFDEFVRRYAGLSMEDLISSFDTETGGLVIDLVKGKDYRVE
jgi:hypothetical protein